MTTRLEDAVISVRIETGAARSQIQSLKSDLQDMGGEGDFRGGGTGGTGGIGEAGEIFSQMAVWEVVEGEGAVVGKSGFQFCSVLSLEEGPEPGVGLMVVHPENLETPSSI